MSNDANLDKLTPEEEFNRDKEILNHIQHRYEEEERRFQSIDSKISSMIGVLVMIFTIQASVLTNIMSNNEKVDVCLIVLFITSLALYLISIYYFIDAHNFKKFLATPEPSFLMDEGKKGESEHVIVKDMIALYGDCVEKNEKIMENKTKISKKGFNFLIYGGFLSFIFFVCLLLKLLL